MRVVAYSVIRDMVLGLANLTAATATAGDLARVEQYIQRRGRQCYQFHWWNETMLSELRTVEEEGDDRVRVPLDQATQTAIGLVRSCTLDDPLSDAAPRPVRWVLSGDHIYLPNYGYTTVWIWFQTIAPADFSASVVIPLILKDAIAHAAYADFLRPSAKTSEVPLEDTAGFGFLTDEVRKQTAMQRQAGRWVQR